MRNFVKIGILIYLFILPAEAKANVQKYDDDDLPISFEIEILPWEKAKDILPKGKKFTVIDVETGKQFKVQRRAGSRHADVQPLTTRDTKIMKEIYDGKWSWKRRGIIVKVGDQFIAASMHGMPHGAGALQNGFPGHFCIHFLGSTTHRSGKMDKLHQLMILKAGGKEEEYLYTVDPYEMIEFFVTGLNYQDPHLLKVTSVENKPPTKLKKIAKSFTYFRITSMSFLPVEDLEGQLVLEVPIGAKYHTDRTGKVTKNMTFILRKNSVIDRWRIDTEHFFNQIEGKS
ncbi:hypothetical protein M3175_09350 [Robertmurraya korlensis]|uniref:hypothetical protein n=1 Tax=Robertmurraya korlensis TaxID=519977 RepID=UPI00203CECBF|nr:hypothetical protein [Robertmurraya korlensis]MCM3600937.1 hypothetical protein [Robertmurraya korlensis]